jgi:hypothetical protein
MHLRLPIGDDALERGGSRLGERQHRRQRLRVGQLFDRRPELHRSARIAQHEPVHEHPWVHVLLDAEERVQEREAAHDQGDREDQREPEELAGHVPLEVLFEGRPRGIDVAPSKKASAPTRVEGQPLLADDEIGRKASHRAHERRDRVGERGEPEGPDPQAHRGHERVVVPRIDDEPAERTSAREQGDTCPDDALVGRRSDVERDADGHGLGSASSRGARAARGAWLRRRASPLPSGRRASQTCRRVRRSSTGRGCLEVDPAPSPLERAVACGPNIRARM